MKKQINIIDLLYILELDPSCMDFTKKGYQQALSAVGGFKELIRKQRKRLAKKYHPDSNGGDDTMMKEVNNAADLLLTIEIKPIPRPTRPEPQFRPVETGHMVFQFYNIFKDDLDGNRGTTTSYTYTWTE